jgi:transcriptional regulator with XRE-family HTH domain
MARLIDKTKVKEKRNKAMAALLREGLRRTGGNQSWVAKYLECSPSAVSRFFRGEGRPSFDNLPLLAYALDINFETLIRVGGYGTSCYTSLDLD